MVKCNFRLTGTPPEIGQKSIDVKPEFTVAELKKVVKDAYDLNPVLQVQFIFRGKVIPDGIVMQDIGIHPTKDTICVFATQSGG